MHAFVELVEMSLLFYDRDVDLKHIENLINNELKKHKLYDSEIGVSIGFNKRLDKYDHLVDIQKRVICTLD